MVGIRKETRFEQFGIRVQRNRIDELRRILRLKAVANGVTPIAARLMGSRLARAGIPCCVGGEHGHPSALSATALCGTREIGHMVAVPETFLSQAVRILNVAPPSNADLTELTLEPLPDRTHPH